MIFRKLVAFSIWFIFLQTITDRLVDGCPTKCFCQGTTVICSLMNLRNVPSNLAANTTLLDLRYNNVKLEDDNFGNTLELESLLLSNNEITTVTSVSFKSLTKLRILHLHKNKIETIERDAFGDLHNLKQLFLHNNNLKVISQEAFSPTLQLENLRLDNNPLTCNNCELFWFVRWLLDNNTYSVKNNNKIRINGACDEPTTLKGKFLQDFEDFTNSSEIDACRYPRFTVIPQNIVVEKIHSVGHFACGAKGYKRPRIFWKHNGVNIDVGNRKYKLLPDGLTIEKITHDDQGIYECIANNDVAVIRSKPAILKIKSTDENETNKNDDKFDQETKTEKMNGTVTPSSFIASAGDTVQMDCFVQSHERAASIPIFWFKNNFQLREIAGKIKLSNNGSLILYDVQIENSGKYDCITTEPSTFIFGSSELIVNSQPEILTTFSEHYAIGAGTNFEITCSAKGHPIPVISWYKNGISLVPTAKMKIQNEGTTLSIPNTSETDSGMYTCLAQNTIGSVDRNTELRVKSRGARIPRIVIKPFDIDVPQFSSIEIPCKADGEPYPNVRWLKNNNPLNTNISRLRVNNINSLRIFNVSINDSGIYTCIVSNIYGNDSASGTVTVINDFYSKNDKFIVQAFQQATLDVDRAINATLNHLFAQRNNSKSPEFLMKFFRYPDEHARNILKPAEIYSRTLANVRKHILSGLKLNITDDFLYKELLSVTQLELIANLSGCVPHLLVANCSDRNFHTKYSTIDGTCNNLQNPMWGSSYTAFRRILKPIYENGFNMAVGWNKDHKYYGHSKPAARLVSTQIIRTNKITSDDEITHMVMQWGQFLDHDLDHALPSTTAESWEGLDCKKTCAYSEPCFPMEVPPKDSRIKERRCMDFIRSSAVCGSGTTSVFFDDLHPREQLNQLTSYIDASQVYGFVRDRSFLLRELRSDLGLLRVGITAASSDKPYLPTAGQNEVDCRRDLGESNTGCFLAGDIRVNEQVGLLAMHTIWLREHNRLATELRKVNPNWGGDTLYYEARRIVIAQIQHITYEHWLPLMIGKEGMQIMGPYTGYDAGIDPTISNVFATAALRIGHTIINPELARLDQNYKTIPQGNLSLGKAFFSPWRLVEEGGVDPLMRGFFATPAKKKMPHQNLNDELIDKLFTAAHAVSLDLAAMNIQRSRDHGLPGYLEYRKFCNLNAPETFDGLENDITDADVRQKLKTLYGHPGNVDVWVGGVLEDTLQGAKVGPLFRCLLIEQFKRLRDGDRFWYENRSVFSRAQLQQLNHVTLARILCDNGDYLTQITENVFVLPRLQNPQFVSCSQLPKLNMEMWRGCGAGSNC